MVMLPLPREMRSFAIWMSSRIREFLFVRIRGITFFQLVLLYFLVFSSWFLFWRNSIIFLTFNASIVGSNLCVVFWCMSVKWSFAFSTAWPLKWDMFLYCLKNECGKGMYVYMEWLYCSHASIHQHRGIVELHNCTAWITLLVWK